MGGRGGMGLLQGLVSSVILLCVHSIPNSISAIAELALWLCRLTGLLDLNLAGGSVTMAGVSTVLGMPQLTRDDLAAFQHNFTLQLSSPPLLVTVCCITTCMCFVVGNDSQDVHFSCLPVKLLSISACMAYIMRVT